MSGGGTRTNGRQSCVSDVQLWQCEHWNGGKGEDHDLGQSKLAKKDPGSTGSLLERLITVWKHCGSRTVGDDDGGEEAHGDSLAQQ